MGNKQTFNLGILLINAWYYLSPNKRINKFNIDMLYGNLKNKDLFIKFFQWLKGWNYSQQLLTQTAKYGISIQRI